MSAPTPEEPQFDPIKLNGLQLVLGRMQQLWGRAEGPLTTLALYSPAIGVLASVAKLPMTDLVSGVGINLISEAVIGLGNTLLRIGKGEHVPDDELKAAFERAIDESQIGTLSEDRFHRVMAQVVRRLDRQHDNLKEYLDHALGEIRQGLRELAERPSWDREPYRSYLDDLQTFAEHYLNRYVLELMPDRHEPLARDLKPTPGAVEAAARRRMGQTFYAMQGDDPAAAPARDKFETFDEVFTEFRGRVLLLGDPGAGKTTTLMTFARDAALRCQKQLSGPLPIVVRISSWDAEKKLPLHEWLAEQTDGALSAEQIARLMASGQALLLLDGLDELGGIRDLSPDEALTPGSSPSGRGEQDDIRDDDDDPVRAHGRAPLRPDNPDAKKTDPRRAFMAILPAAGPVVVSCRVVDYVQIGEKARLNGAVTLQPLGPAQIEAYLSGQPDLWAAIKDDKDLLAVASTPLLLSYFAYAFRGLPVETKALRSLSKGEVRTKIFDVYVQRRYDYEKRTRPHNVPILREEMERVLGEVAYANFGHWRANVLDHRDFRRAAGDDAHAEAVIAQARMLHLLAGDDLRFVHLLLRDYFAAPGAVRALKDADEWVRRRAAEALGQIGDARAVEPLIAALKDDDEDVRQSAAIAMRWIRDARAVEPLIAALNDANWEIRSHAALALGGIRDARAVEPLIAALNDADAFVRRCAAKALGRIKDARAVEPLIAALKDADSEVRGNAADALGDIRDARAVEPLIAALNDADRRGRINAAKALGRIKDARAVEPLIAALKDANWNVRSSAAAALWQIGDARAVEPLTAALNDSGSHVRSSVAVALGRIKDARAVEPLTAALKDDDEGVRSSVTAALERIGTPEAMAAVEAYRRRGSGGSWE